MIQDYFKEYGIFTATTTIEGMLVTEENLTMFLTFLKENFPVQYGNIYPFDRTLFTMDDELTFIRLLLGGECDYGMGYKWLKRHEPASAAR